MRGKTSLLLVALLAGGHAAVRAETPAAAYTLFDLGPGRAVGINDAGTIAVNSADSALGSAHAAILTVDKDGKVLRSAVVGLSPGNGDIVLHGIAPNGTVVGVSNLATELTTFCAPNGTFQQIDRACAGTPLAVSNLGRVVVDATPCDQSHTDPVELLQKSEAWAMNASGVAVGQSSSTYYDPQGPRSFATQFSDGAAFALSVDRSSARAVNAAGKVVGWVLTGAGGRRSTLWHGGQHDIDAPGSYDGQANDINDHNQVAGQRNAGSFGIATHGFLTQLDVDSVASDTDLPPLSGATSCRALALNEAALVVGTSETASGGAWHAVSWSGAQVADLNTLLDAASPGLPAEEGATVVLTSAQDVNANGDIVCTGELTDSTGTSTRAYLLRAKVSGLVVSPGAAAFGNVVRGDAAEITLTVTNGLANPVKLSVTKPAHPFIYAGPAKFTLAPGASKDVKVRCAPPAKSSPAALSGVVVFKSADAEVRVPASVNVVPEPVAFSISPSVVDFGDVLATAHRSVTITNLLQETLTANLSAAPPFATQGSVTLAPGASTDVLLDCSFVGGSTPYTGTLAATPDRPRRKGASAALTGKPLLGARILSISGSKVEVQHDGMTWVPGVVGSPIEAGDRIHTGWQSTVRVQCSDGSIFEVRPMSLTSVDKFTPEGRAQLLLQLGMVRAQVHKVAGAAGDFQVKTLTLTASVRGTQFVMSFDDVTQTSVLSVSDGKVLATPENAKLKPVLVTAGHRVTVTPDAISALDQDIGEDSGAAADVAGDVSIRHAPADPFVPGFASGDAVLPGDELSVAAPGMAEIRLGDGTLLGLAAGTQAGVDALHLVWGERRVALSLARGTLHVTAADRKSGHVTVEVRTPNALVVDIASSEFDVTYDDATNTTTVRTSVGSTRIAPLDQPANLHTVPKRKQLALQGSVFAPLASFKP